MVCTMKYEACKDNFHGTCCRDCDKKNCKPRCKNSPDQCGFWKDPKDFQQWNRWTPEEDKILMDNLGTLSYEEIGDLVGRSSGAVNQHVVKLKKNGVIPDEDYHVNKSK